MTSNAVASILDHAAKGADLRRDFFSAQAERIARVALRVAITLAKGNKLLLCGNGGSAADCQHLAAEFVNRFLMDRPALPAIALTTDTSILTAIGNDFGFEQAFSKQVRALGNPGDMLLAISTSGNSENILHALDAARERGVISCGLTGNGGGKMAERCDILINVDAASTPLIQEVHIAAGHVLCLLTDYYLFENVAELTPYLNDNTPPPC